MEIMLDKIKNLMYYELYIGKKYQNGELMRDNVVEYDQNVSDELVIKHINNGEYQLLPLIIERYMPTIIYNVRTYISSPNIDDAVQEATIALYNAIKTYDPEKSSFSTFASLCIKRAVIGFARKNGAQKNVPDDMLSSLEDAEISDETTPEAIIIAKEDYDNLTQNIKVELSSMEYEVLQLFLSGLSYADISASLKITEKAVDNALSRIRKKLKK